MASPVDLPQPGGCRSRPPCCRAPWRVAIGYAGRVRQDIDATTEVAAVVRARGRRRPEAASWPRLSDRFRNGHRPARKDRLHALVGGWTTSRCARARVSRSSPWWCCRYCRPVSETVWCVGRAHCGRSCSSFRLEFPGLAGAALRRAQRSASSRRGVLADHLVYVGDVDICADEPARTGRGGTGHRNGERLHRHARAVVIAAAILSGPSRRRSFLRRRRSGRCAGDRRAGLAVARTGGHI